LKFACEKVVDTLDEAKPLLQEHWQEVSTFKDIALNPDYERYLILEKAGNLRAYAAREDDGRLFGYAVFFIFNHIHYKQAVFAQQDIIFISKEHRIMGAFFIKFCDEQLRKENITCVTHHVKADFNFGKVLERIGYQLQDLVYIRRLNGN
jgi:hypothetical protein